MGEQLKIGADLQEGRDTEGTLWVVRGNEVLIKINGESNYRFIGFLLDKSLITFRDKSKHLVNKYNAYGFSNAVIEGLQIETIVVYEEHRVASIIIREWHEVIHVEKLGNFEIQMFIPYNVIDQTVVDVTVTAPYHKSYHNLGEEWFHKLKLEFRKEYMIKLGRYLASRRNVASILPDSDEMFKAFKETPFSQVKVVIVGHEPYSTAGLPDGLAFSSKNELTIPNSLAKIYEGMEDDYDFGNFLSPDPSLKYLAEQGVLLLNRILTVEEKNPLSHAAIGWKKFTETVVKILSADKPNVVFLLWGGMAKELRQYIDTRHLVIECEHPSFAAREIRKWQHNNCFTKTNRFLQGLGQTPIGW